MFQVKGLGLEFYTVLSEAQQSNLYLKASSTEATPGQLHQAVWGEGEACSALSYLPSASQQEDPQSWI
jgi:hypothetical protein